MKKLKEFWDDLTDLVIVGIIIFFGYFGMIFAFAGVLLGTMRVIDFILGRN